MAISKLVREGRSWSGNERNCCFLNIGGVRMADVSAVSGLDFADDGRGVALTDWDQDGDLDILTTNRGAPRLRFLQNNLGNRNNYVALRLVGTTCNRDAIGARATVEVRNEKESIPHSPFRIPHSIRAGDGFVSQSSKWLHFGLGKAETIQRVAVRWPDGQREEFDGLEVNRRYRIVQGTGQVEPVPTRTSEVELAAGALVLPSASDKAGIVLRSRVPMPDLAYLNLEGNPITVDDRTSPRLINLWATWCQPCLKELRDFAERQDEIKDAKLDVLALSVDDLSGAPTDGDPSPIDSVLTRLGFPFDSGFATAELVDKLEALQRTMLDVKQPLPLPTSLLVDRHGRLAAIYKGPVEIDRLLADVAKLDDTNNLHLHASPFIGRRRSVPYPLDPIQIAATFFGADQRESAIDYLKKCSRFIQQELVGHEQMKSAGVHYFLATLLEEKGDREGSEQAYQMTLEAQPDHRKAHRNLGHLYLVQGDPKRAVRHLRRGLANDSRSGKDHFVLAQALDLSGDTVEAIKQYRAALKAEPNLVSAANNLAWILATHEDEGIRNGTEAVRLAELSCELTRYRDPIPLDTLAAAYVAVGRFDDAVEMLQKAVVILQQSGRSEQVRQTREKIELYRSKALD